MSKSQSRYFVFSKKAFEKSGVRKPLKNAVSREEARNWKRYQGITDNISSLGIFDRFNNTVIS